jgi:protein-S-isoprenylcysteine O-methyltransferase Ste14
MFLPDIVQPVYPLCLPFSSAYLLIVEVLAIAFNSLWLLMTLALLALVIRYGVITREDAYLERKFGDVYRRYRARVRRWL